MFPIRWPSPAWVVLACSVTLAAWCPGCRCDKSPPPAQPSAADAAQKALKELEAVKRSHQQAWAAAAKPDRAQAAQAAERAAQGADRARRAAEEARRRGGGAAAPPFARQAQAAADQAAIYARDAQTAVQAAENLQAATGILAQARGAAQGTDQALAEARAGCADVAAAADAVEKAAQGGNQQDAAAALQRARSAYNRVSAAVTRSQTSLEAAKAANGQMAQTREDASSWRKSVGNKPERLAADRAFAAASEATDRQVGQAHQKHLESQQELVQAGQHLARAQTASGTPQPEPFCKEASLRARAAADLAAFYARLAGKDAHTRAMAGGGGLSPGRCRQMASQYAQIAGQWAKMANQVWNSARKGSMPSEAVASAGAFAQKARTQAERAAAAASAQGGASGMAQESPATEVAGSSTVRTPGRPTSILQLRDIPKPPPPPPKRLTPSRPRGVVAPQREPERQITVFGQWREVKPAFEPGKADFLPGGYTSSLFTFRGDGVLEVRRTFGKDEALQQTWRIGYSWNEDKSVLILGKDPNRRPPASSMKGFQAGVAVVQPPEQTLPLTLRCLRNKDGSIRLGGKRYIPVKGPPDEMAPPGD